MSPLTQEVKTKCINAAIITSLCFFAGITLLLLILLVQNGIIAISNDVSTKSDIVISLLILGGWITFIVLIMSKAITIYAKKNSKSLDEY